MGDFDVVVVGTGVAGQTAAEELAQAGKRVAVVDKREFGGTCALRGCEPKKTLFAAAEAVERVRGQSSGGVTGDAVVDWPALIAYKRTFTDSASAAIEAALVGSGATALRGTARFVSPETLSVDGAEYTAETFVLAAGALPLPLGIPGAEHVLDNERFMDADSIGKRVVFIGGGYISFEFAHIAAASGAKATILHRSARVLKEFDPDLTGMLVRGYREAGIDVRTDAPVVEVRESDSGFEVVLGDGSAVACDTVVHGAGRVPDLADLALDVAGVRYGRRGIEVDEHMRSTTNSRIYAAGDAAASGPPLTPVGIAQARVVVRNVLEPGSAVFAPSAVGSVVFSDPPLASVGFSEQQARDAGFDVVVKLTDSSAWASSRRVGVRTSGAKTIVERGSGRIVGAHLLGHHAEEVINVLGVAMAGGLTVEELKAFIWAYPTGGWDLVYLL